jgi:hypothetical protein
MASTPSHLPCSPLRAMTSSEGSMRHRSTLWHRSLISHSQVRAGRSLIDVRDICINLSNDCNSYIYTDATWPSYRKAFLMMREMVFMCVCSISIHWLFCNFSVSVFCNPQSPSSVLCKQPTPCFCTLSGSGTRALLDNLSLHSHRSEPHAQSVQGGMQESRCKDCADE